MRRLASIALASLFALTLLAGPAGALPDGAQAGIQPVSAGSFVFGPAAPDMSPLKRNAASYCRRDCDACRHHCYQKFRVHCYGYECKQHFVLCMRGCWKNICRWC
ncbi:MAG: hypothetical protein Kow0032_01670 [Methyloligellaceae bacterium]